MNSSSLGEEWRNFGNAQLDSTLPFGEEQLRQLRLQGIPRKKSGEKKLRKVLMEVPEYICCPQVLVWAVSKAVWELFYRH